MAVVGASLSIVIGCAGDDMVPTSVEEQPDGSFMLLVECAHDVSARLVETPDEVRVDQVKGDRVDGDCLGSTILDLSSPIDERALVVDGERWVRIDDDCELAVYSYEDVAEKWGWAVPLRCPAAP